MSLLKVRLFITVLGSEFQAEASYRIDSRVVHTSFSNPRAVTDRFRACLVACPSNDRDGSGGCSKLGKKMPFNRKSGQVAGTDWQFSAELASEFGKCPYFGMTFCHRFLCFHTHRGIDLHF
jgi:hypothetical protein